MEPAEVPLYVGVFLAYMAAQPERQQGAFGHATAPCAATTLLPLQPLQPPPEDAAELCLALNRMQRQNLKLTSKVSKAKDESADRWGQLQRCDVDVMDAF